MPIHVLYTICVSKQPIMSLRHFALTLFPVFWVTQNLQHGDHYTVPAAHLLRWTHFSKLEQKNTNSSNTETKSENPLDYFQFKFDDLEKLRSAITFLEKSIHVNPCNSSRHVAGPCLRNIYFSMHQAEPAGRRRQNLESRSIMHSVDGGVLSGSPVWRGGVRNTMVVHYSTVNTDATQGEAW